MMRVSGAERTLRKEAPGDPGLSASLARKSLTAAVVGKWAVVKGEEIISFTQDLVIQLIEETS